MNKYEVGYEDCLIGVYYADDENSAIRQCMTDINYSDSKIKSEIMNNKKFKPFLAVKVNY